MATISTPNTKVPDVEKSLPRKLPDLRFKVIYFVKP